MCASRPTGISDLAGRTAWRVPFNRTPDMTRLDFRRFGGNLES